MNAVVQNQFELTKRDARFHHSIHRLLQPCPKVELHHAHAENRQAVEGYVARKFADAYGATITEFMPDLLSMSCHHQLSSVAGLRSAQYHPLFLERYLNQSVEHSISELCGESVKREGVIEIGNLVATHRGSSQLLFVLLTAILYQSNNSWVVFTATPQVQKILNRLGIKTYFLAEADPSRLTLEEQQHWGKYYESRPRVIAGNLADGIATLNRRPLLQSVLSLYQSQITELAGQFNQPCGTDEKSIIAA